MVADDPYAVYAAIATELSVSERDVESMEIRLSGADQSLNATISADGEDAWQDFLADDRPDPEYVIAEDHDMKARSRWLHQSLMELNERERTIISERRLQDDGKTLEELGQRLGISKERVRQIEHRALQKMRSSLMEQVRDPGDEMVFMHTTN